MFDELAERSLMSPLAGMKHTYVRLAIVLFSHKTIYSVSNCLRLCLCLQQNHWLQRKDIHVIMYMNSLAETF